MDRRGLAYDQASLISFPVHAKWVAQMILQKHRVPPPGYGRVSWSQLHNADVELFTLASQKAKGGIRPSPSGAKPLDALLTQLMEDSRVTFFMMPLPMNTRVVQDSPAAAADRPPKRQKSQPSTDTQMVVWTPPAATGKGKAKKGKGKGKGNQRSLPTGQLYKVTKSGKDVCNDFNSPNGCSAGSSSSGLQACPKGLHLCWAPRCRKRATHGFCSHKTSDE